MTSIDIPAAEVSDWARRIRPHLSRTVAGIIAAGHELIAAKEALAHGEFGPLLNELGLSRDMAQRFMRVAAHPVLGNAAPAQHLPPSITILDELTRLPVGELKEHLTTGTIGPATTRRDVAHLRSPTPEEEAEPLFAPGEQDAILDTLHEEHGDDLTAEQIEQAVDECVESKQVPEWQPAKPDLGGGVSHPARYSSELIPLFADLLRAYSFQGARILDPFAGTGRIHLLHPEFDTVGVELEKEYADLDVRTQQGDATDLPFEPETFDAIVTSPTYGNRLADSHNAADPERRRSYTHDLGRTLTDGNSGRLHWRTTSPGRGAMGSFDYRNLHEVAWDEAVLVLRPGGLFILNCCDHVRDGLVQPVTSWHCYVLGRLGLEWVESRSVPTRKLRQGANDDLREQEQVHVFRKLP